MTSNVLKWHTRIYIVGDNTIYKEWALPLEVGDGIDQWQRLEEIKGEWEICDMVGIVPYELCTPTNLYIMESVVNNTTAIKSGYHQFSFSMENTAPFLTLIDKICKTYKLTNTKRTCAPWVCSIEKMQRFIKWYRSTIQPVVSRLDDSILSSEYYKRGSEKDIKKIKATIVGKLVCAFFDTEGADHKMTEQFMFYETLNATQEDAIKETIAQRDALHTLYNDTNITHDSMIKSIAEYKNKTDENKRKNSSISEELSKYKTELDTITNEITNNKGEYEKCITNKKDLLRQLDILKDTISKEKAAVTSAERELAETTKQFEKVTNSQREQISVMKGAISEMNMQTEKLSKEMRTSTVNLDRLTKSLQSDKQNVETMRVKLATLTEEKDNQKAAAEGIVSQLDAMKEEYNRVIESKKTATSEMKELKDTIKVEIDNVRTIKKSVAEVTKKRDDVLRRKRENTTNLEMMSRLYEKENKNSENAITQLNTLKESIEVLKRQNEDNKVLLENNKVEYDRIVTEKNDRNSLLQSSNRTLTQEMEQVKREETLLAEVTKSLEKCRKSYSEITRLIQNKNNEKEVILSNMEDSKGTLETNTQQITLYKKEFNETILEKKQLIGKLAEIMELYKKELEQIRATEAAIAYITKQHDGASTLSNNNQVIIYILCHTETILKEANKIYKSYSWATPILMKYQDATFENAFWKQLYEIKDEWVSAKMVGTLSFKAHKKLNLNSIDAIIKDPKLWNSGYFHFMRTNKPIPSNFHPHLITIISSICEKLELDIPTENCCNYWMCTPEKMIRFLLWFEELAYPAVMEHPLSAIDANYKGGTLKKDDLIQLSGVPFYTHAPFVFERIFLSFFLKLDK